MPLVAHTGETTRHIQAAAALLQIIDHHHRPPAPAKISNPHLLHRGLSLPLETPKNEVYPVNSKKGIR